MSPIATVKQDPSPQSVSYDTITMPVMAGVGAMIIISGLLVKVIWNLSVQKNRIDNQEKAIATLTAENVREEALRSQLREEIKQSFKAEIQHGFELFDRKFEIFDTKIDATLRLLKSEIDSVRVQVKEGLDARNATIQRLHDQTTKNAQTILEIEAKLNQSGIPFRHRYRFDEDPPSTTGNYS